MTELADELFARIVKGCDLNISPEWRQPIVVVGAGGIVNNSHLPAYRRAGADVVGIYDRDEGRAQKVASRHGIPRVFRNLDEALSWPASVVDIAVPPDAQLEIASVALDAGKDLLCQKPLSLNLAVAEGLVRKAKDNGRLLAVNLQLRFAEVVAATKLMVDGGWIGEPTVLSVSIRRLDTWGEWPWLTEARQLDLMFHTIHYLDMARYVLGEPKLVFGIAARRPGQGLLGETITTSVLLCGPNQYALLDVNHQSLPNEKHMEIRVEGSEGAVRMTFGLETGESVEVWSRLLPSAQWYRYPNRGRWFPDAFAGPMRSLLQAAATGGEPVTSGADHLLTLRLIRALYKSAATGEQVSL